MSRQNFLCTADRRTVCKQGGLSQSQGHLRSPWVLCTAPCGMLQKVKVEAPGPLGPTQQSATLRRRRAPAMAWGPGLAVYGGDSYINNAFRSETANQYTVQWWFKNSAKETRALTMRNAVASHWKVTVTKWEDHGSWSSHNYTRSCWRTQRRPP